MIIPVIVKLMTVNIYGDACQAGREAFYLHYSFFSTYWPRHFISMSIYREEHWESETLITFSKITAMKEFKPRVWWCQILPSPQLHPWTFQTVKVFPCLVGFMTGYPLSLSHQFFSAQVWHMGWGRCSWPLSVTPSDSFNPTRGDWQKDPIFLS